MGTYTANYQLYMPTIGEQGWGDLMNGNLTTIDTTMAGLNTRLTAVENEVNGNLSCTSVTTSGKVTANGGIGTKALSATSITNSGTLTQEGTSTFTGKITANGGVNDYEERITACENVVDGVTSLTVPVTTEEGFIKVGEATYGNALSGYNWNNMAAGTTWTLINAQTIERTLSKPEYISYDLPMTKEVTYSLSGPDTLNFAGIVTQNGEVVYTHTGAVSDVSIIITLGVPITVTLTNNTDRTYNIQATVTITPETDNYYIA